MTDAQRQLPAAQLPDLPALRAIADPARRFVALRAAQVDIARLLKPLEAQAGRELLDRHQGNWSAAAREVAMTRQAFTKRLESLENPAGKTASSLPMAEPARYFPDAATAIDALLDYELRLADVTDELEPLLLGCAAVGVPHSEITRRTGVGYETLARLVPDGEILVAREIPYAELDEFAQAITAHADDLDQAAVGGVERTVARLWASQASRFVTNCAYGALMEFNEPDLPKPGPTSTPEEIAAYTEALIAANPPEEDPAGEAVPDDVSSVSGHDAWLATECVKLTREARVAAERAAADTDPGGAAVSAAVAHTYADIAAAMRHLRRTGATPETFTS